MKIALHFSIGVMVGLQSLSAHATPAIAMYGNPKYSPNFQYFDYVNADAPKGGAIRLESHEPFDSMNPFLLKGVAAPGLQPYVFQTLMTPSLDEPQSYYPLIADTVTLAPDRSYADFTLNPAARWQDGNPITADDVVWSFQTLKDKGHPLYRLQYKPMTIEKRDAQSVRFRFDDKTRRELPLIAASLPVLPMHGYCSIGGGQRSGVSKNIAPASSSIIPAPQPLTPTCIPFDKTTLAPPLGSGPYRVARIDPGRAITYERVKNYWAANLPSQRGFYNFDTVHYDIYRDDVVAIEGIKSHQFDFYEEFIARHWATSYDIPAVKSGELVKARIPHKIPRGMQGFIFNTRLPKFADPRVRQAIGLTLDFEWMNRVLFYSAYERNRSFFNNTDFEAKDLPGADELALLSKWHCPVLPPAGGRLGGGHDGQSVATTATVNSAAGESPTYPASPPPNLPPAGGGANVASPDASPHTAHHALTADDLPPTTHNSYCLPPALFTTPYAVPTTDGTGDNRANLIQAQTLLDDAGWIMKNGRRVNAKTGEPLTIEFLMTQRTFERVIAIMRQSLARLGIDATFRYVDASQYQKRVDHRQFDIVSIWWNQGVFYPGQEQYQYWHSSQADTDGSQNLGGVKNPAVDSLVEKILRAQDLKSLEPAGRALDRVLLNEYYIIPHWTITAWRLAWWNQFGRPKITPAYSYAIDSWWAKLGVGDQGSAVSKNIDSAPSLTPHREGASMTAYILRRILLMIPTLLGILLINFLLIQAAPGGPVEQLVTKLTTPGGGANDRTGGAGELSAAAAPTGAYRGAQGIDPDLLADIKKQYGFDRPAPERFWRMLTSYARFDFGTSFFRDTPVIRLIAQKLPVSISLGLWTTLIVYLISIPLGIRKAVRDGSRFDMWTSTVIVIGQAVPGFLFAVLLLILFAGGSYLQWLPLRGLVSDDWAQMNVPHKILDYLWHMVLPVTAMVIGGFASLTFITKNSFIEEISKHYVITARAKGLPERKVLYGHVFRNAMLIVIAGLPAAILSILFTSALLIEVIFSLDGLGLLGFESALSRDYPVMFGTLFIFTLIGLVLKLLGDVTYMLVDPRIDFERRG